MIQYSEQEIELSQKEIKEIGNIINSGKICNGEYTKALEDHFIDKFKVNFAIACASCTSGLIIALRALGIKNKAILLPAFTWESTRYALECNNNYPVWADINLDSWDIDSNSVIDNMWEAQISVDIFGNESYLNIKNENDFEIPTVYDAAHGYGLENLGHRGDIEVVSLGYNKPVTAMQGGVILFNDEILYQPIKDLVQMAAKITEVSAFVGLKSIENYEKRLNLKLEIIEMYRQKIATKYTEQYIDTNTNYSAYSIRFSSNKKRNDVFNLLKENGIETKIYYKPLIKGFQNTEKIYRTIISLPVHSKMISEVSRIANLINEA